MQTYARLPAWLSHLLLLGGFEHVHGRRLFGLGIVYHGVRVQAVEGVHGGRETGPHRVLRCDGRPSHQRTFTETKRGGMGVRQRGWVRRNTISASLSCGIGCPHPPRRGRGRTAVCHMSFFRPCKKLRNCLKTGSTHPPHPPRRGRGRTTVCHLSFFRPCKKLSNCLKPGSTHPAIFLHARLTCRPRLSPLDGPRQNKHDMRNLLGFDRLLVPDLELVLLAGDEVRLGPLPVPQSGLRPPVPCAILGG